MKLSIITINYNNIEGLHKTLASVAAQTYRDIEHIIIDGGSTDGSVDVIKEYESTIKQRVTIDKSTIQVKWVSEKDNGIYNAMNKGIEIALGRRVVNADHTSSIIGGPTEANECVSHGESGGTCHLSIKQSGIDHCDIVAERDNRSTLNETLCDYVWILNSGDCAVSTDVVERMINILEYNNYPLLLGNKIHVYPGDKRGCSPLPVKRQKKQCPAPINTSMLTFYRGTIPQDAAFVRRDLFEKYGLFDDSLNIVSDWKLYLNMIAMGDVVPMYVDIDVVLFDMTGVSNSNMERRNAEKRTYLEQLLPASVLKDYDAYSFPIEQYNRLKKYHLWGLVYFMERVLFKFEKWHFLR